MQTHSNVQIGLRNKTSFLNYIHVSCIHWIIYVTKTTLETPCKKVIDQGAQSPLVRGPICIFIEKCLWPYSNKHYYLRWKGAVMGLLFSYKYIPNYIIGNKIHNSDTTSTMSHDHMHSVFKDLISKPHKPGFWLHVLGPLIAYSARHSHVAFWHVQRSRGMQLCFDVLQFGLSLRGPSSKNSDLYCFYSLP